MACVSPASLLRVSDIHISTAGGVRAYASPVSDAGAGMCEGGRGRKGRAGRSEREEVEP